MMMTVVMGVMRSVVVAMAVTRHREFRTRRPDEGPRLAPHESQANQKE
jgi:hypothetical protein